MMTRCRVRLVIYSVVFFSAGELRLRHLIWTLRDRAARRPPLHLALMLGLNARHVEATTVGIILAVAMLITPLTVFMD